MTTYQVSTILADGVNIFYRYAGPSTPNAPTILLLHGFPSSSHMFRNLIPFLASRGYRVLAPDLPGFGFTSVPAERNYVYTFANLTTTIEAFVDVLRLTQFAVYIFDYGAPTGLRLALKRPELINAIVTQNGNAYAEGLGEQFWAPLKGYWASGSPADRAALRGALTLPATKAQYTEGSPHPDQIPPETWTLDQALMDATPGNKDIQLDLFYDYRTNVELYPAFQKFLRESGVPVLAMWGKNDTIFIDTGAEAYKRDVSPEKFVLSWLDAGHFALETNEEHVAGAMSTFFEDQKVFH